MRTSNGHLVVAADRAHGPLLQRAQQLRLQRERQLADLVEEQRAAVGLHEQARCGWLRASVNAPRTWPNSSLSSSASGMRRAVDRDERPLAAPAARVERARDQLLAGAALAGDQHRGVGVGDPLDQRRATCASPGSSPSSVVEAPRLGDARGAGASPRRASVRCCTARAERERERVDLDRLGDEVVGAGADRGDRVSRGCRRR